MTGRAPSSPPMDPKSKVAWALLSLLCLASPWPLGGHAPGAAVVLAGASALTLGAAIVARRRDLGVSREGAAIALVILAAGLLGLLQLVELPCDALTWIAADSVSHRRIAADLVGLPSPARCTLTQSVGATELFLVRSASAAGAFSAALLLASRRTERTFALGLVALTGGVLALVGVVHGALGLDSLFGLYTPVHAHPIVLTPLLNNNNLAGLLTLTSLTSLGLARGPSAKQRTSFLALGALQVCVLFATQSRGGIAAFLVVAALAAVVAFFRRSKRPLRSDGPTRAELALALVGAVAIGAVFAYDGLSRELEEDGDDGKLVLLARGAALALEAPPLGFGRGVFGQAIAPSFPYDRRVDFAENALVQGVSDFGAAFAAFAFTALAFAFFSALAARRSRRMIAAAFGLLGLFAQNLVDFSLELPGVAVPAAVALGALVASRHGAPKRRRAGAALSLATLAFVAYAALGLGPALPGRTADAQVETLRGLAETADEPPFEAIREAFALHPRDPAVALLAAHLVHRTRPEVAGPFLNRSLELSPHWASTHLEIARWLLTRGRGGQAALHLARAADLDVLAARELTCAFIAAGFGEEALHAAPEGPMRARFVDAAVSCVSRRDPRSPALERLALAAEPEAIEPQVRRAERDCATNDEHLDLLRALTRAHRSNPRPHLALTHCLLARKQHKEAKAVARTALTYMPALRPKLDALLRGGDPSEAVLDRQEAPGEGVFDAPTIPSR